MPRYFFHIRTPDAFTLDDVGLELRDLEHVKAAAEQGARDIMAEDLRAGREVDHQKFEIVDEGGVLVHELTFRDMLKAAR